MQIANPSAMGLAVWTVRVRRPERRAAARQIFGECSCFQHRHIHGFEDLSEDVFSLFLHHAGFGRQNETVRADVREDRRDVLRHDEIAPSEEGMGLRHPAEGQCAAGADAKLDHGMGARGLGEGRDIVKDAVVGFDVSGRLNEVQEFFFGDDGLDAIQRVFAVAVTENVDLAAVVGGSPC